MYRSEVGRVILRIQGHRSKSHISFSHRQCLTICRWTTSKTWVSMKVSWMNHHFKRWATASDTIFLCTSSEVAVIKLKSLLCAQMLKFMFLRNLMKHSAAEFSPVLTSGHFYMDSSAMWLCTDPNYNIAAQIQAAGNSDWCFLQTKDRSFVLCIVSKAFCNPKMTRKLS